MTVTVQEIGPVGNDHDVVLTLGSERSTEPTMIIPLPTGCEDCRFRQGRSTAMVATLNVNSQSPARDAVYCTCCVDNLRTSGFAVVHSEQLIALAVAECCFIVALVISSECTPSYDVMSGSGH